MTKLLKDMCLNLSDSLNGDADGLRREQNYQKQLNFYRQIYEKDGCKEKKEALLVAARCLISISRSLCESEHSGSSIEFARDELLEIKDVFENARSSTRKEIQQIANKRIAQLSKMSGNELADSFLFLYMSLLQL